MPYLTQRFANRYPTWSKIRADPSSAGQRVLSSWAELFEVDQVNRVKLSNLLSLLTDDHGRGYFNRIELTEADEFPLEVKGDRLVISNYPTVTGTTGTTVYTLERVDTTSDFLYPVPTRLSKIADVSIANWLVFDSTSNTIKAIDNYDRLVIEVVNSNTYYNRYDRPFFGGHSRIVLQGFDPNQVEITEVISVSDDGAYRTQNVFSELTEVYWDGFNGDVNIYSYGHGFSFIKDKFKAGVLPDIESPLFLQLVNINSDSAMESFTQRFTSGRSYRRGGAVSIDDDLNFQTITTQRLYDANAAAYSAVDLAVSPSDGRLYVVDDSGVIHVYEHSPGEFSPSASEETEETYMDIVSLKSRTYLGEAITLRTWFRALRAPVEEVKIRRSSPSGVVTYLQADGSWASGVYKWKGNALDSLPETSWNDITFSSTFDELGQWDFYCEHDLFKVSGAVSHIGILCDHLTAIKDLITGISSPDGIFFSDDGELCVVKGSQYASYDLVADIYFADVDMNEIIVRETYDEVEIQYG